MINIDLTLRRTLLNYFNLMQIINEGRERKDLFGIYFRQMTLQVEEHCSIILIYCKSLIKYDRERKDKREGDLFRIYFRQITLQA